MFELTDSTGNKLFETISITLVCGALPDRQSHGRTHRTNHSAPRADDCMKTENPEKCTHKMAEMPRWLSSKKMDVVRSLLGNKRPDRTRTRLCHSRVYPFAATQPTIRRCCKCLTHEPGCNAKKHNLERRVTPSQFARVHGHLRGLHCQGVPELGRGELLQAHLRRHRARHLLPHWGAEHQPHRHRRRPRGRRLFTVCDFLVGTATQR